jgi:hypothetical protein
MMMVVRGNGPTRSMRRAGPRQPCERQPVLEIADHVLDHTVLAVAGLQLEHVALAVGDLLMGAGPAV